jgi:hypothetical protein
MLGKAGVDNQLPRISLFTQLFKQPCRQANWLSFHTGFSAATTALAAMITALIKIFGHFYSL